MVTLEHIIDSYIRDAEYRAAKRTFLRRAEAELAPEMHRLVTRLDRALSDYEGLRGALEAEDDDGSMIDSPRGVPEAAEEDNDEESPASSPPRKRRRKRPRPSPDEAAASPVERPSSSQSGEFVFGVRNR